MTHTTVYLRTSLFSLGGPRAHVPAGVMIIEGNSEYADGGLTIEVDRLLDERGRELSNAPITLRLPMAKVDHLVVHAEGSG